MLYRNRRQQVKAKEYEIPGPVEQVDVKLLNDDGLKLKQNEVLSSKISELSKSYKTQIEQLKNLITTLETKIDSLQINVSKFPIHKTKEYERMLSNASESIVQYLSDLKESFDDVCFTNKCDQHNHISKNMLFDHYTQWCYRNNEKPLTFLKFKDKLIHYDSTILYKKMKLNDAPHWGFEFPFEGFFIDCSKSVKFEIDQHTMVKLICAVVGVGSVFSVNVELSETVDDLKKKVKEENPNSIGCDAALLKLYLAREGDTWLNSRDEDIKALKNGEIPDRVKSLILEELLLDEAWDLNDDAYFGNKLERVKGDIHVLVECPPQPDQVDLMPPLDQGWTARWLSEFYKTQIPSHNLPPVGELADFIKVDLPAKIAVHEKIRDDWIARMKTVYPELVAKIFRVDNLEPCVDFLYQVGRSNRPDYLFIVDSVCVFRGEEKAPGEQIDTPRRELFHKLIWSYGDAPYLFGYAAVGYEVRLYAITHAHDGVDAIELGIIRDQGIKVLLEPDRVVKCFPTALYQQAKDHVQVVYKVLEEHAIPNVDRLDHADHNAKRLVFKPRGREVRPAYLGEVFHALANVLQALVKLHAASWMHRDIRWANVIQNCEDNSWFLIAFMDAAPSPQVSSSGNHLNREEHAPEIFASDSHSTVVDIWSVGLLIRTCGSVHASWYDTGGERSQF
ncbi:unnamed protein product [Phytophthora lilii]|uniref:Unnamed protein product n=1 Tax=Phytophthora lilii TaxID=2077276 RepID=A0A9W6WEE7_9STRA|nr:unnamed protein product [Phytophthora lilii]